MIIISTQSICKKLIYFISLRSCKCQSSLLPLLSSQINLRNIYIGASAYINNHNLKSSKFLDKNRSDIHSIFVFTKFSYAYKACISKTPIETNICILMQVTLFESTLSLYHLDKCTKITVSAFQVNTQLAGSTF